MTNMLRAIMEKVDNREGLMHNRSRKMKTLKKNTEREGDPKMEEVQDKDNFLLQKYIKRSGKKKKKRSACGETPTKQLLNTGGGPQIPRKAN